MKYSVHESCKHYNPVIVLFGMNLWSAYCCLCECVTRLKVSFSPSGRPVVSRLPDLSQGFNLFHLSCFSGSGSSQLCRALSHGGLDARSSLSVAGRSALWDSYSTLLYLVRLPWQNLHRLLFLSGLKPPLLDARCQCPLDNSVPA